MASPHATHEEIAAARRALFPADEPWEAKAGVSDLIGSITRHCGICPHQPGENCHLTCFKVRADAADDGVAVSMRLRLGSREGVFLRTK